MKERIEKPGYYGVILDIDLSTSIIKKTEISHIDYNMFLGGRGLGAKLLWDNLPGPGVDPLSKDNVLIFMPGPFSSFPVPSSSRTCIITKSPITSPKKSPFKYSSTISYSNMGGFFGPEVRFAGYDGIIVRGKASKPSYIFIHDDRVEIRDAGKFWGMGTEKFDQAILEEMGNRRFQSCYIGQAGENLVTFASIINTTARAAGRGGTGCVMGSKNLKAIVVKGSRQPDVSSQKRFIDLLDQARKSFKNSRQTARWRRYGTASALISSSDHGTQAVKNYREGTFIYADKIGAVTARRAIWQRNFACYVCPLACKKSGIAPLEPYAGIVHDGPEYETGTMLGANLMISDINGILKAIWYCDNYGLDAIATGNAIGFLMEAYDKNLIDRTFLDGIDLKWGNVDSVLKMIKKIAFREGIGNMVSKGVRYLAEKIGQGSKEFAIESKGHAFAAWNVHTMPTMGLCYATANRGACHLNGHSVNSQDRSAVVDSTGLCFFAKSGYKGDLLTEILQSIVGNTWDHKTFINAGDRIFNLEKCFNYREGFRREDDSIPDRFFKEPLTVGSKKGAVLEHSVFKKLLDHYYSQRRWDIKTTRPSNELLHDLGLDFARKSIDRDTDKND